MPLPSRAGLHVLSLLALASCAQDPPPVQKTAPQSKPTPKRTALADVLSVEVDGNEGDYYFEVTVRSPDRGCDYYANWWEVMRPDGSLVYRRILGHSHVDEQPFTRRGGPVKVGRDELLVLRAHLHPYGYGGVALQGSVATGFEPKPSIDAAWASKAETLQPLPERCAF